MSFACSLLQLCLTYLKADILVNCIWKCVLNTQVYVPIFLQRSVLHPQFYDLNIQLCLYFCVRVLISCFVHILFWRKLKNIGVFRLCKQSFSRILATEFTVLPELLLGTTQVAFLLEGRTCFSGHSSLKIERVKICEVVKRKRCGLI